MEEERWRRERLAELSAQISRKFESRRWRLLPSRTAIQPLIEGENAETVALSDALATEGIRAPAICPPAGPKGSARLRISWPAAHAEADVDMSMEALLRSGASFS